jgi:hypothetical protein
LRLFNSQRSGKFVVAQHSVQLTVGTHRVLSIFMALSFSRFDGESTIPSTAANSNRWAHGLVQNFIIF